MSDDDFQTTFGSADDAPDVEMTSSPLDDLIAELGERIDRLTSAEFDIDGRPGWWARFDTGFSITAMRRMVDRATLKKGQDPDMLKLAFLLVAETCTAIGKDDTTVFEAQPSITGAASAGPFKNGAVEQAIGEHLKPRPDEKSWQAAIRWVFGADDDERVLLQISAAVQSANAGEVVERPGARPTD